MAPLRVMIVDDEKEYLDALSERLALRGIQVTGATGGEEALGILDSQAVDVVVLDVMMPGLSGMDTLIALKKRHKEVPVIMLSGHADVRTAIDGMERGAFEYLMKPVDLEELIYKIEDACNTDKE